MARTHSCHHTMVIRANHGPPVTWALRGDVVTFVIFVITVITIATTAGATHTCKLYQIRSHGGNGGRGRGGRAVSFISQQVSTLILKLRSSVSRTTLYLLAIALSPSLSFSLSVSHTTYLRHQPRKYAQCHSECVATRVLHHHHSPYHRATMHGSSDPGYEGRKLQLSPQAAGTSSRAPRLRQRPHPRSP